MLRGLPLCPRASSSYCAIARRRRLRAAGMDADLKPGKDMKRVHLPVHHRMIADPPPHQKIGAQKGRHSYHGQFLVGFAYWRSNWANSKHRGALTRGSQRSGAKVTRLSAWRKHQGNCRPSTPLKDEQPNSILTLFSSTYRVIAPHARRRISGSFSPGRTQKRPISTILPRKFLSADKS